MTKCKVLLVSVDFLNNFLLIQEPGSLNLTYAVSFLPLARSSMMLEYYNNIDQARLCDSRTEIVAMDFGE